MSFMSLYSKNKCRWQKRIEKQVTLIAPVLSTSTPTACKFNLFVFGSRPAFPNKTSVGYGHNDMHFSHAMPKKKEKHLSSNMAEGYSES